MILDINRIERFKDKFYVDGHVLPIETTTLTEIGCTLYNKGKALEMKITLNPEDIKFYNSVPDYKATVLEVLYEVLQELKE
ncbi:hypothetical protein [Paenibacillus illinoisensis]|uniref:hypothetical protein n=1 Tax=Paenibacillus illinoisensis TaxID=59845 RepID=UPI00203CB5BD|nr:hypothetical protein [Paenibacillus illinoisensis]MCM3208502.1 hypothetical protein [Paenibacillus illinoisensis]